MIDTEEMRTRAFDAPESVAAHYLLNAADEIDQLRADLTALRGRTAPDGRYKPTERQEQALAELVEECRDHGLDDVSRFTLTIAPRPELRSGRGCDIDVSFIGSDYAMSTFIDVYGNGDSPYFLSVDWLCYEYDPCELCVEEEEVI